MPRNSNRKKDKKRDWLGDNLDNGRKAMGVISTLYRFVRELKKQHPLLQLAVIIAFVTVCVKDWF